MKERLVEDWLIRINERGYEVPFAQSLCAKKYHVLRCGHSPTEHGKDVIAIAPDGVVCGYQLKTGDFGQAEITRHLDQINMLVEALPLHPNLPPSFIYRPFLVTTGEFKYPAVSLIQELNASWQKRNLPRLELINGRQLQIDLIALSLDFWPVDPPAIRQFRELYLVDGRGDLDLPQYARFLTQVLSNAESKVAFERRVAAANLFASYLLSEFSNREDHWSLFQGWTICAAQIASAAEEGNFQQADWRDSFTLAEEAAASSLKSLGAEVLAESAFRVSERELDEFSRSRNTVALAAASCWQLIADSRSPGIDQKIVELLGTFLEKGRVFYWGEGAFSQFLMIIWLLEKAKQETNAKAVLTGLITSVAERNAKGSENSLDDPYLSADECLTQLFSKFQRQEFSRKQAVESYSLFPLVLLAVRRNFRAELEKAWRQISSVDLTFFKPERPSDVLRWHCDLGQEHAFSFDQPQKWEDLRAVAIRDDQDRMPLVLRNNLRFGLMFLLAFPQRILPSLVKHLDDQLKRG
jgi:hypothetical protein